MAWDDPSPRARPGPATSRPSAQPGYGSAPISFGRLVFRVGLAGMVGVLAAVLARSSLAAWHGHGAHSTIRDGVLAFAIGFAVAVLAWKHVMNRPGSHALSASLRDRGAWGGGSNRGDTVESLFVADAVVDLVEVAVDVLTDL